MKKLKLFAVVITALVTVGLFSCKHTKKSDSEKISEGTETATPVKLAAPKVTATAGDGEATLIWANVPNTKEYKLTWNGGTAKTVTSPHTEKGLTNGTKYTYSLVAKGDGSKYADSDAATGAVIPNIGGGTIEQKLTTPKITSAKAGDKSAIFTWEAVTNAKEYVLTLTKKGESVPVVTETISPPKVSHSVSGLTNAQMYVYSLVAKGQTIGSITYTDSEAAAGEITPTATYTVKFEANGGTPVPGDAKVEHGKTANEPAGVVKEGFILEGWYKEGTFTNKWDFTKDTVTEDITLYAKWKADSKSMVTVNTKQVTIIGADTDSSFNGVYNTNGSGVFIKERIVKLDPYEIGRFEVSYDLWKEVYDWAVTKGYKFFQQGTPNVGGKMGGYTDRSSDHGYYTTEEYKLHPVTCITWGDAVIWCNAYTEKYMGAEHCVYRVDGNIAKDADSKLPPDEFEWVWPVVKNAVCDLAKKGFRLPTEAEWEFAARDGQEGAIVPTKRYAGCDDEASLTGYAWYDNNSSVMITGKSYYSTHEIGTKKPTVLGIYDLSGNVTEWCFDWMRGNGNPANIGTGEVINPLQGLSGEYRHDKIIRGGHFCSQTSSPSAIVHDALVCYRGTAKYYEQSGRTGGFRVVRTK